MWNFVDEIQLLEYDSFNEILYDIQYTHNTTIRVLVLMEINIHRTVQRKNKFILGEGGTLEETIRNT